MTKKVLFLIFLMVAILASVSFADDKYEILSYTVNAKVEENAIINIEEIISVNFKQPRHGIYRDIPTHYNGYDHKISDINVVDPITNKQIEYSVERISNVVRIKIGSADKYVNNDVNYKIMYSFDYGDNLDGSFDSIYFNFIGNNWNSSIPISKVNIDMPKSFDKNEINFTTGKYGSKNKDNVIYYVFDNRIEANVNYLYPYEGVTFAIKLPEGYFKGATIPYNRIKLFSLIGAFILIIVVSTALRIKNKDNNKIVPILSFKAPDDLNPAELSYIYDEENIDTKTASTIVLYWASKGYLNIIVQNGVMTYESRISPESISDKGERKLYEAMFNHGNGSIVKESQLTEVFHSDIEEYIMSIRYKYSGEKEVLIDSYQNIPFIIMIIMTIVTSVLLSYDLAAQLGTRILFSGIGLFIALLISEILIYSLVSRVRLKGIKKLFISLSMVFLILAPVVIIYLIVASNGLGNTITLDSFEFSFKSGKTLWIRLVLLSYGLNIAAAWSLLKIKKISSYAKKRLNKIYGFKDFLEKAKVDEIKSVYYDNPSYYYDMIPYVMIFGFADLWAKHAENLDMDKPDWYKSGTDSTFDSYYFYRNFDRSMLVATALPEPEVSSGGSDGGGGFSGGGFSGGGAGGGGGGSW